MIATATGEVPDRRDLTGTDPGWVRPALAAILLVTALSYTWAIQRGALTGYYAGAVRSMAASWHVFFFGGLDPAGWLSLDKLPGAFWLQALTVRVFGYSIWSLVAPQLIAGLLTVLVTYRAVRRYAGATAGLIGCAVVAVMPVSTALSRGNVSDAISTLLLVLAADATLRSLQRQQPRSLLLAGLWIGLAFQAKMVQAWLVIPILVVGYLLAAPQPLIARIRQVIAMTAIAVAVSLSWMIAVSLVPAAHRPYADGSSHNSVFEQVFVYNAFGRVGGANSSTIIGSGVSQSHTGPSPTRLLYGGFALGVGWLIPLALLSAGLLLWVTRSAPRTDLVRTATVMWSLWLVGHLLIFSVLGHINDYYLAILVPAIAGLVAPAAVSSWQSMVLPRWGVPSAIALSTGYALLLLGVAGSHWTWLRLVVAVLGAVAVWASWPSRRAGRRRVALALAALLVVPLAGSVAMDTHDGGPYTFAFSQSGLGSLRQPAAESLPARYRRPVAHLLNYVEPKVTGEHYLMATDGSDEAAILIAATGRPVLPIGGYSTRIPAPTLDQLRQLLDSGQLRFVLAQPESKDPRFRWVAKNCQLIKGFQTRNEINQRPSQLYDCRRVS